jgi:cytochrome bd ubiquinol oxidase subunit I
MDLDPVFVSRIQFAFVISFHIVFPAFTIGLAAWLATIEGARLVTGNAVYRRVFDFWLKVFALSFGMGVVTGIVMAFQFGTNWSVLAQRTGPIQGPLLGYEAFTAFLLEATFFGVMLLGRERVSPLFYFFACCMVSLGTMFSSFWILANNSWMRCHSATRSWMAGSFLRTGGRSRPDRSCGYAGRTCCSRPSSRQACAWRRPARGMCCAVSMAPKRG